MLLYSSRQTDNILTYFKLKSYNHYEYVVKYKVIYIYCDVDAIKKYVHKILIYMVYYNL